MRKIAAGLAALLLATAALAAPGDFYPGGSTLPGPKADWGPCKNGDTNRCFRALDYNTLRDALGDLRTGLASPTIADIDATGHVAAGTYLSAGTTLAVGTNATISGTLLSSGDATFSGAAGIVMSRAAAQSILKSGGTLTLGTSAAYSLIFQTNGGTRWTMDTTGNLTATGTPTVTSGSLTLTGGDLSLSYAGTQRLTKSNGALSVGTTSAYSLTLVAGGTTFWTVPNASGNLQGTGTNTITGIASPVNTSDAATKGYVDGVAGDTRQATTSSCSTSGTTLFTVPYNLGSKIRIAVRLYAPSGPTTTGIRCTPSTAAVDTLILKAWGGTNLGAMGPTLTASTGTATNTSATVSTGARPGILDVEGLVYVLGSGSSGSITCQCITTGSTGTLSAGSWYSYGFDNP